VTDRTARSFETLVHEVMWHSGHVVVSAGVAAISWLVFEALGRDPDVIESGWVFFCVLGILVHRENLSETYRDRAAVMNHPSSNEADLRNLGNHIRGEWLRIATKLLFMVSGFVSLYFMPRVNETLEIIRSVSVISLMTGVAILDIDAILDKVARRELVRMVIAEINARPLGLSTEERLERAIKAARDMYHDDVGEWAIVVGALEHIRYTGETLEGLDVPTLLQHIEDHLSALRDIHALIRSYEPAAGGPSRKPVG
jgi:hypothetical protein